MRILARWLSILDVLAGAVGTAVLFASAEKTPSLTLPQIVPQGRILRDTMGVRIRPEAYEPELLNYAGNAGFGYIRIDFLWSEMEKTRGKRDFSGYQKILLDAMERRMGIYGVIGYGNPVYSGKSDIYHPPVGAVQRRDFALFTSALISEYRNTISWYQIWSYPNRADYFKPEPNPASYRDLFYEASRFARETESSVRLAFGGLDEVDFGYLERLSEWKVVGSADDLAVGYRRRAPPEVWLKDLFALRAYLKKVARDVPVDVVVSDLAIPATRKGPVTEEVQARYAVRMFLINYAYGVPLTIWSDLEDVNLPDEQGGSVGLISFDRKTVRPVFRALATMTDVLGNAFLVTGRIDPSGLSALKFRTPAGLAYAYWVASGSAPIRAPDDLRVSYALDMYGRVLEDSRFSEGILWLTESEGPLYIYGPQK
ncbi:MAG: hypothetical protein V2G42_04765 [bacterium JZ-2024 1]